MIDQGGRVDDLARITSELVGAFATFGDATMARLCSLDNAILASRNTVADVVQAALGPVPNLSERYEPDVDASGLTSTVWGTLEGLVDRFEEVKETHPTNDALDQGLDMIIEDFEDQMKEIKAGLAGGVEGSLGDQMGDLTDRVAIIEAQVGRPKSGVVKYELFSQPVGTDIARLAADGKIPGAEYTSLVSARSGALFRLLPIDFPSVFLVH